MNTVQVKNTVIGEGRPKICVPIVGKTKTDIPYTVPVLIGGGAVVLAAAGLGIVLCRSKKS